jgi:hypothetical protein
MKKGNYKLVHILIDKNVYERLQKMETSKFPSVSHIIRDMIDIALDAIDKSNNRAPGFIQSSVQLDSVIPITEIAKSKAPLEIPVITDTPVIESEPLISHKNGRKVNPDLYSVMKARRARDAGRDYDKSLEPHFHLLDELR